MRARHILLLLFLAAAVPVMVNAQEAPLLAEDSANDVRISLADQSQPPPAGRYAQADLVSLRAVEAADAFTFTLGVTQLRQDVDVPLADSMEYFTYFQHKDRQFRIHTYRFVFVGEFFQSQLEARDGTRGPFYLVSSQGVETTVDAASNSISVTIPRDLLLDASGSAPHPGVPLTGFWSSSLGQATGNANVDFGPAGRTKSPGPVVTDRMPNEGNGTGIIDVQFGVRQLGSARLFSEVPTRSSNGENTTFVYQVQAVNLGNSNDRYDLVLLEVPSGWSVRLPASNLELAANETLTFPVILSTPFEHLHGSYKSFLVEMRSQTDASTIGRIALGVRYPAIPQPAGHHPTLQLRSLSYTENQVENDGFCPVFNGGAGCTGLYMNAAEEDLTDTEQPVPGFSCGPSLNPAPEQCYDWCVPLVPGLEMGLDFVTSGTGVIEVPVQSTVPLNGVRFTAELYHTRDVSMTGDNCFFFAEEVTLLAAGASEGTKDIAAGGGKATFAATLVPTLESDNIPFTKNAGMFLMLRIQGTGVPYYFGPLPAPEVLPGAFMTLPLLDYHDPVNLTFASGASIEIIASGAMDRLVNPGKSALFNLTLVNHGASAKFRVDLAGNRVEWAEVLVHNEFDLASGEQMVLPIAVRVPGDAVSGQTADLVVTVANMANLNERALARIYATVDTGKTHADDTVIVDKLGGAKNSKKAPGPEMLVVAVAALALAGLRRDRLK